MKITDVRAYVLSIPIREKEFPAPWSWGKFSQVIVEVKTDEEITGYGESFGYGGRNLYSAQRRQGWRNNRIPEDRRSGRSLQCKDGSPLRLLRARFAGHGPPDRRLISGSCLGALLLPVGSQCFQRAAQIRKGGIPCKNPFFKEPKRYSFSSFFRPYLLARRTMVSQKAPDARRTKTKE